MTLQIGPIGGGRPAVLSSADGKTYTSEPGLKPGSVAILYSKQEGSTLVLLAGTTTVNAAGVATWKLARPAPAGSTMLYDGVFPGLAGLAPAVPARPAIPAATPLPVISIAPAIAHHVKVAGSSYSGPAVRVARVSDGAQADIPFGPNGPDMDAARAFAGSINLPAGLLVAVLSYDTTGGGNHITWSTGASACPFVSECDHYGSAFLDRACVLVSSFKYPFASAGTVQRFGTFGSGLSLNAQSFSFFSVSAPMRSANRDAMVTHGAVSGAGRVTLFNEGGGAAQGLGSLGTTNGTAATATSAPFSMAPRNSAQVFTLISGPTGKLLGVEDRFFQGTAIEDSRTLVGGGIGITAAGNTYWYNGDFFAHVAYAKTVSESEATQVRGALAATYETARRDVAIYVMGSSTPEGQGSTLNQSWPKGLQALLPRRVDLWNGGISGMQLADQFATAAERIFPVLAGYAKPILIIDGIANDFLQGKTAAQGYATLKNGIAAFKQQFPDGLALPVTATGKSTATASQNNARLTYNDMVRAATDLNHAGVIDRAAIPQALVTTDEAYFWKETDGSALHAMPVLHALYAQAAADVVQRLIRA